MGDDHVQECAGGVVEGGAVGDVEGLRDVDLDFCHVFAVPHPREQPVGKTEDVKVLGALLPQKVVDPVDLLLVQGFVDRLVESPEAVGGRTERLLVDDSGSLRKIVRGNGFRVVDEGGRWEGQIVDQLSTVADGVTGRVDHLWQTAGVVDGEPAAGEADGLGERFPFVR